MIDTKEQLHQRLKDIKTQLRLSMNGVVSQSMREKCAECGGEGADHERGKKAHV